MELRLGSGALTNLMDVEENRRLRLGDVNQALAREVVG